MRNTISFTLLIFLAHVAQADVSFQPRVITGLMDYEFTVTAPSIRLAGDRAIIGNNDTGVPVSDTMPFLGVGGTLSFDRNFADFYYSQTDTGEYDDVDSSLDRFGERLTNISNGDIDRKDWAIAFGRAITDKFSLAIGYKRGETELKQSFNLNDSPHTNTWNFDLDGPFVAASYGIPLGSGVLGFNLAVADLKGDYVTQLRRVNTPDKFTPRMTGDATGLTVGISWKAPINNHWLYALSLDGYQYDFDLIGDAKADDGPGKDTDIQNAQLDIEEQALTARFALIYRF